MRNSLVQKLSAPMREFGFGAGLLYSVDRVLQRISPRLRLIGYDLIAQPIAAAAILPERFARNFIIREIRRGDSEVTLMPARPDIKEERFDQGAICLGAFRKGALVGYMWFCFDAYREDEVRCTYCLAAGRRSVFDFDFYIFPEHRSGMGFAALWNGANAYLRERGVSVTYSRVTITNVASRRAHAHLGARRIGRAFFLQMWEFEIMLSGLSPHLHATIGQKHRVRLKLE